MHSNRHTPKISVITVTYNAGEVLEDTIQSVISQTYHHVEYILVDGASRDHTMAIANRYRERIHKIISEPDKGLYDAMNKGISLATGDYLCFLNAGDSFHEDDTLQQMVHSINGSELPDVLYGETAIVDKDRHFLHMRRLSAPEKLTWKSFKQGMLVCHQAFLARHTVVEPYDLQYRFSADFDWCIRVMKKARTLHNDHPEPQSIASRTLPYYGAPLWNSQYRSPSYLVYISCNHQEIKQTFTWLPDFIIVSLRK